MVLENIWSVWPFRGYFGTRSTRRCTKQNSRCGSNLSRAQVEPLIQILGPWESKMVALQSILIWEKPGKSLSAIFAANILFWVLAFSEVKFFFGVSILGLAAFLHHEWVYSIWPEISVPKPHSDQEDWTPVHPSVLSAPEVSRYLEDTWKYIQEQQIRLAQLRKKQPGWFCVLIVTLFSFLWLLGRFVPGVILLYTLLMVVMCGPAVIIHLVPKSTIRRLQQLRIALFGRKNDGGSQSLENDLAEFLPEETSDEVQNALGIPLSTVEIPGEDFPVDDLEGDSKIRRRGRSRRGNRGESKRSSSERNVSLEVGNSFTSGLSESDFPTIEDSLDLVVDESDLVPEIPPAGGRTGGAALMAVGGLPTDVSMNFVSTHFGDSFDDDDFSSGLTFRRTTPPPSPPPTAVAMETSGYGALLQSPTPSTTAASVVMTTLMGNLVSPETFLSSIGQHLASALGTSGANDLSFDHPPHGEPRAPGAAPSAFPEEEEEESSGKGMTTSESSLEEEFELISDDDLH